ncbi:MAG: hypothetical protein ACRC46_02380 [Thermoguttaceae bacterium]
MTTTIRAAVFASVVVCAIEEVNAIDWINTGTGNWETAANWNPTTVPTY